MPSSAGVHRPVLSLLRCNSGQAVWCTAQRSTGTWNTLMRATAERKKTRLHASGQPDVVAVGSLKSRCQVMLTQLHSRHSPVSCQRVV